MADGRLPAGGAVAAAFAAAASWLCCMPFALGALGAFSSGIAHFLGPLQPYITGLSMLLLAVAFYQTYRRTTAKPCALDEDCDSPALMKRKRRFLWAAATIALLLITVPYWLNWVIFWSL